MFVRNYLNKFQCFFSMCQLGSLKNTIVHLELCFSPLELSNAICVRWCSLARLSYTKEIEKIPDANSISLRFKLDIVKSLEKMLVHICRLNLIFSTHNNTYLNINVL